MEERLTAGLRKLNLEVDTPTVDSFIGYTRMVLDWNRRFNLISKKDEAVFVERHLIDSLVPAQTLAAKGILKIIDIGSGAGLPGIPIHLALPGSELTLLEPNRKKSLFLLEVKDILELATVRVMKSRVEEITGRDRYQAALVRAVRWDESLARAIGGVLQADGCAVVYRSGSQKEPECRDLFHVTDTLQSDIPLGGPRKYFFLRPRFT
jgi:16S rRNA (guanine527-N7)-methyltransferase